MYIRDWYFNVERSRNYDVFHAELKEVVAKKIWDPKNAHNWKYYDPEYSGISTADVEDGLSLGMHWDDK